MSHHLIVEEVSLPLTAPRAFAAFHEEPFSFFLDSGMDPVRLGRYSFMGSQPFLVLRSRGKEISLWRHGRGEIREGNPFAVLKELLEDYRWEPQPSPLPFTGGAVGYFSYDLCHFIERLPARAQDDLQLPECYLAFYDAVVGFDHRENKMYICSSGLPEQEEGQRQRRAAERLAEIKEKLGAAPAEVKGPPDNTPVAGGMVLTANFTREGYLRAVAQAREYICAGDIFQVNLSQRFQTELALSPYDLYCRLREVNPAPFAAYLSYPELAIACASPERFLKVEGDRVETRPIKGTRPRGTTPTEDGGLARELLESAKDRAENIMIVDLERNDLGKVCRYGSVRVEELAILETYPTVFHLVSTVVGRLAPGKSRVDLLQATFPGGSITGAPKVRAMEIIDELEPTRRSVYTGAIGYLGCDGSMDLNIVIRTFLIKGRMAYFQVGGGIVYDSEPEAEYQETLDKAKGLVQALNLSPQVMVEATR